MAQAHCTSGAVPRLIHRYFFMFTFIKLPGAARSILGACAALSILFFQSAQSQAALSLSGTRVVFDSDKRSVSLIIANPSENIFAVQTWVNTTADDTTTAVPFMPSPTLFRLNPGKEQQVQINALPNTLPTDRESLFYFNVQEIPQADTSHANALNIALRTRIKLFYRPSQIKDNPQARLKDLQWSIEQVNGSVQLVVYNPTPFHVSFSRLEVSDQRQSEELNNPAMSAPLQRQTFALGRIKPTAGLQVTFATVNDYGAFSAPLTAPVQLPSKL